MHLGIQRVSNSWQSGNAKAGHLTTTSTRRASLIAATRPHSSLAPHGDGRDLTACMTCVSRDTNLLGTRRDETGIIGNQRTHRRSGMILLASGPRTGRGVLPWDLASRGPTTNSSLAPRRR